MEKYVIEKRIDDIEIRMSHLENYLKQLNEVVLSNSRTMEALKAAQSSVQVQLNDLNEQLPGPESSKPPHY